MTRRIQDRRQSVKEYSTVELSVLGTTTSECAACHDSCCMGRCDNGGGSSKWMYELVGDMRML